MKGRNMKNLYVLITVSIVIFSSSLNAQWIRTNGPSGYVYSFAASDTNLYAGTGFGVVFHSTNNGTSWTASDLMNDQVRALAVSPNGAGGTNLFAGNKSVFLSTDNGTSWTAAGLTNYYPQGLVVSDTNLFAGTYQSGAFLSTNNGTNWTAINTGLMLLVNNLLVSGTNIFAGTWGGGIYRSTNNGTTWTAASDGLTSLFIHATVVSDTNLFAGTYFGSGVYLSTDNGTSWTTVNNGLTNNNVRTLAVSGSKLFAGTDGSGVFLSTNNGASWTIASTGLTNTIVNALVVSDTFLFAGTGDGVWRRPLSEIITGIEYQIDGTPSQFELEQNYPNPFNPSTTIKYSIPTSEFVTLKIFDVLGNEIATLVNENKSAGSYEINFNASNLSSGIYLYTLQAESYTQTKKLILLR